MHWDILENEPDLHALIKNPSPPQKKCKMARVYISKIESSKVIWIYLY